MPAPILAALGKYFAANLSIQVWPEEIPRFDTQGNAINPQASVSPSTWPVVQLVIEGKATRDNTFEDSYSENVPIVIMAWGTSRSQVDNEMATIEASLAQAANWAYQQSPIGQIFSALGWPNSWLYDMEIGQWTSQQRENERLFGSQLLWTAEMDMVVGLHGNLLTM